MFWCVRMELRTLHRYGGIVPGNVNDISQAALALQLPAMKMVDSQGMEKAIIASPTGLGANCLSGTLPPNAFTTNSLPPTT
jgi:hypothetical protein